MPLSDSGVAALDANADDASPDASNDAGGDPPLPVKSIGFTLDYYNPATEMAGEMKFTKLKLEYDLIWQNFGTQDPRTTDPTKKNPQPLFILPLGTKARSLVDGEVINVQKLYSNDYTVWVARNKTSSWIYETEHVINAIVKVGDKVTAGQVLAEVSDYDATNHPGFGTLEIGILAPPDQFGNPMHECPFKYLDAAVKDDIRNKIKALLKSWEDYLNNPNIYDEGTYTSPGCATENAVGG